MTVRLVMISWTAGPLLQQAPVTCDSLRLVRPYVGDGCELPEQCARAAEPLEADEPTLLHYG